jgi:putative CocE/NonD family hydrolase
LFYATEKNGPPTPNTLIMGPWSHGGWSRGDDDKLGNLDFRSKTGEFFREHIELPFFVAYLKDKPMEYPKAWLFETGTDQWIKFDSWPPQNSVEKSLYFGPGGTLSFTAPAGAQGFDQYVSDPAKPVPVTAEIGSGMPGDYMTYDQRFASRRTDVLTYQTEPLEHDVVIAGPIRPVLRVSTSGTDSDFDVKLIDVYPNDYPEPDPNPMKIHMGGYQQMVRGEPFRGKFRNSFEKPEPFTPNQPAKIEFGMPDICHVFRPGHRIMVQIQSSWFPLVDLNPQTFTNIYKAERSQFHKADEKIYRSGATASVLRVNILPAP